MLSSRRGDMSRCTGTGWGSRLPTVIRTSTAGTDQEISGSLVNSRKLVIDCKADCEECSLSIYIYCTCCFAVNLTSLQPPASKKELDAHFWEPLPKSADSKASRPEPHDPKSAEVHRQVITIFLWLNYGSCCVCVCVCASISVSKAVCIKIVTFCDINLRSIKLPITNTTH